MGGGPRPVGGWGMHPRRRYGGGCLGGALNMILGPIILILVVVFFLFSFVRSGVTVRVEGGYDEETFQDYANSQYEVEFGRSSAYEDNLLITVLVDEEECYEYYYIAWVGDHIATDINHMLGNDQTELGQAMNNCISTSSYKYSLDSNLAQVMDMLTQEISGLNLESSFTCTENHAQVSSHLTNHSDLDMTESTVNEALARFTEATGIPAVIVVEDMNEVFGRTVAETTGSSRSFTFVAIVGLIAVMVIVFVVKSQRRRNGVDDDVETAQKNSQYHQFDDQY